MFDDRGDSFDSWDCYEEFHYGSNVSSDLGDSEQQSVHCCTMDCSCNCGPLDNFLLAVHRKNASRTETSCGCAVHFCVAWYCGSLRDMSLLCCTTLCGRLCVDLRRAGSKLVNWRHPPTRCWRKETAGRRSTTASAMERLAGGEQVSTMNIGLQLL